MRALFVGGVVDNSELEMDHDTPPACFPQHSGNGRPHYRLHQTGHCADGSTAYAVYAAPEMADDDVERVADARGYARRFDATTKPATL